jgi:hypothetical protein
MNTAQPKIYLKKLFLNVRRGEYSDWKKVKLTCKFIGRDFDNCQKKKLVGQNHGRKQKWRTIS